jgi:hypothetical protein
MENKDKRWLHIKNITTATETLIDNITDDELLSHLKSLSKDHELNRMLSWGGYDDNGNKICYVASKIVVR